MVGFPKLCASVSLGLACCTFAHAQNNPQQTSPPPPPTLRVTSNLVFLDVTVLDKKGRPVVTGLTKNDFTITEDGKPQRIFSFEAPDVHAVSPGVDEDNPDNKAPVTILVLDLLDSRWQDFAYIQLSVRKYLMTQPERLAAPAEMLVVGNQYLSMIQGYTRSRADLLYALDHLPPALPMKLNGAFFWERFTQSIDALQQIALQSTGVPGRKNIIWIGHGGPNLDFARNVAVSPKMAVKILEYAHMTTNMLVKARISLFVIYPGLPINQGFMLSAQDSNLDLASGDVDPFFGEINFGLLANETGGKLYYNRNDVDKEIARSAEIGSNYYTLTYQPQYVAPDGKFRHVRVTVRDRSLRVITKAGYYAPDDKAVITPDQERMIKFSEALQAAFPINSLHVDTAAILRHPDSRSVQINAIVKARELDYLPDESGKQSVQLLVAAASLNASRRMLSWRVEGTMSTTPTIDPGKLAHISLAMPITVPYPRKTKTVRIVVQDENNGRMGSVELDKSFFDNAPEAPTPSPGLVPRPSAPARAATNSPGATTH